MRYKPIFLSLFLLLTLTSFTSSYAPSPTNLRAAQSETEMVSTVHTDKLSYMLGELVKINGTTKEIDDTPIESVAVAIEVKDPPNQTIFLDGTYSLVNGTYKSNFRLPTDAPWGQYNVYVTAHKTGYSTATNKTSFNVEAAHDIAITNVAPSKTVAGEGYTVNITLIVENQGDFKETFNVTAHYNETAIILPDGKNYTTVTLPRGNSTTLTVPWDTTGVVKGNYTVKAEATPVAGETDLVDNTLVDGWVVVTIPGDIDGDYDVDYKDLFILARAYGCSIGDECYVPNADLDCNGKIDYKDLFILARHYGQEDP